MRYAVAQARRQWAAIYLLQRHTTGTVPSCFNQLIKPLSKFNVITFHVELEVEAQASRIPVGRPQQHPAAIYQHKFGVVEWRRGEPDSASMLKHLRPHRPGSAKDEGHIDP